MSDADVALLRAVWIAVNLVALGLTAYALFEAIRDYRVIKLLNGKAREIASRGDVRRESFRIIVNLLLLSLAVPVIPPLVVLMAVPVALLTASFFDLRERRRLISIIARETVR